MLTWTPQGDGNRCRGNDRRKRRRHGLGVRGYLLLFGIRNRRASALRAPAGIHGGATCRLSLGNGGEAREASALRAPAGIHGGATCRLSLGNGNRSKKNGRRKRRCHGLGVRGYLLLFGSRNKGSLRPADSGRDHGNPHRRITFTGRESEQRMMLL